jgi:hypothetical protein
MKMKEIIIETIIIINLTLVLITGKVEEMMDGEIEMMEENLEEIVILVVKYLKMMIIIDLIEIDMIINTIVVDIMTIDLII